MTRESPPTTEQQAPIRHIQTIHIRFDDKGEDEAEKGRYVVTPTDAIRAAGLDGGTMFRYIPEEVENLGVVPALGAESGKGHPRDNRTYSVRDSGGEYEAYRLTVPESVLEALGIEPDSEAAQARELPMLDVFAGDGMIAFDKSNAIAIPTTLFPDGYDGDEDDEVVLQQVQTTVPRMRSWGDVSISATPALKQVGDDISAVTFYPDLAAEVGGVVPAIGLEDGDGRSDDEARSVYREGPNREYLSVPISDDVLAALDLSKDDFEDVSREDRPALTVYISDRIIALGRPGERTVAVDRSQTPVEPTPTLTDIAGIGPTLADELTEKGFETVEDLYDATREDLLAIDQLGETRAEAILDDISRRVDADAEL